MKKWIVPTLCVVCAIFLLVTNVTHKGGVTYTNIGKTYNKFLFIPAKSAHFTIAFKSAFSGGLTLIDQNGNTLPSNKYTISVDGRKTGASFSVSKKRLVHVSIRCSKMVSPGKQYIQVRGGGPLVTHVYFTHHLNPLFVWLSWLISLFATLFLVWFLLLKRIFFPQFSTCQKTIMIPGQAPLIVKMSGARMVVISTVPKRQGFLDALIKGPVVYKVHPAITSPIYMRPVRGGRILVMCDDHTYRVKPNPMPKIGMATINNVRTNINITIN